MPAEPAFTRHIRGKLQAHGPDAAIAEIARQQHGVVSRRQLVSLGLGEDAIDARLRLGRLHRLHRGVYAVGHDLISRKGHWMAAVLAGGDQSVLSHRSAAALWQVATYSGAIEITSPRTNRSRGAIRRHCTRLPSDEITVLDGIPVTSIHRTLFDYAGVSSLDRYPGARGNANLRLCLERLGRTVGFTRSDLEELFLPFLDRFDLPRPHLNARLQVREEWIEVDCLWRERGLAVELDSRSAHGTRSAFEADRERDRRLQAEGWRVVRITWRQLHDEPERIARDLRRLMEYKRT
jgi:Transcriptional regulator, AbiEi antitoxin/Protein of unknown function (DUF559)